MEKCQFKKLGFRYFLFASFHPEEVKEKNKTSYNFLVTSSTLTHAHTQTHAHTHTQSHTVTHSYSITYHMHIHSPTVTNSLTHYLRTQNLIHTHTTHTHTHARKHIRHSTTNRTQCNAIRMYIRRTSSIIVSRVVSSSSVSM